MAILLCGIWVSVLVAIALVGYVGCRGNRLLSTGWVALGMLLYLFFLLEVFYAGAVTCEHFHFTLECVKTRMDLGADPKAIANGLDKYLSEYPPERNQHVGKLHRAVSENISLNASLEKATTYKFEYSEPVFVRNCLFLVFPVSILFLIAIYLNLRMKKAGRSIPIALTVLFLLFTVFQLRFYGTVLQDSHRCLRVLQERLAQTAEPETLSGKIGDYLTHYNRSFWGISPKLLTQELEKSEPAAPAPE